MAQINIRGIWNEGGFGTRPYKFRDVERNNTPKPSNAEFFNPKKGQSPEKIGSGPETIHKNTCYTNLLQCHVNIMTRALF